MGKVVREGEREKGEEQEGMNTLLSKRLQALQ
jgi:hypothetical protein